MTYARSIFVTPGSPGTYHCVSRCVRRVWLCGEDREKGRSYEHRRQWVEDRIGELAEIFALAVWGYAVMSKHLHVVVEVIPCAAATSDFAVLCFITRDRTGRGSRSLLYLLVQVPACLLSPMEARTWGGERLPWPLQRMRQNCSATRSKPA